MIMKNTMVALALALSASLFGNAAVAAPISPSHNIGVTDKLTDLVHYRGYRHCHRRYGRRHCHGGYAYYGGPSIYLGFGGRRHHRHHNHFRSFRHGGGHMMRGPGRMHHRGRR
jgi:hypothetical protein